LRTIQPAVVINAAAYTAVDNAETDQLAAEIVNAAAPGHLAAGVKALGALLVQYSTDYVFDGRKATPYTEDDPPSPINVYGASKLAGERAVVAEGCDFLIIRTSWVYGLTGNNFLRTIRRLSRTEPELRIVADQTGAPTWSRQVAEATTIMLARFAARGRIDIPDEYHGVYHLTASGAGTWYDFACAIVALDHLGQPGPKVTPVASSEYPCPAQRPKSSLLDCTKVRERFGVFLQDWRSQLRLVFEEMGVASQDRR
jgi:dTDP-4-dehydrorhamnose reductase